MLSTVDLWIHDSENERRKQICMVWYGRRGEIGNAFLDSKQVYYLIQIIENLKPGVFGNL